MEDVMSITPLGSGQEVGRSCHLVEFRGLTILLDCGIHPGLEGMNGLPFLDRVEPERIDILLLSHFHLDHAASLPYFTERTAFRGRVICTHPTKAVVRLLLGDYIRLLQMRKEEDMLYTEAELQACVDKMELVDYHETISIAGGLSVTALNAGHVLGAAMFLLEWGGRTVLYTGDYSMEEDRHLMAADIPSVTPDVLIVESTFGVQVHASRTERETRFTGTVERIVTRGGRCLIPVFALGRAQELLLILDEYWQANPHLHSIPIWYASKLASRALRVYQTYANMMNHKIRAQMDISNPFRFNHIRNLKSVQIENFDDASPSVVFASPGMLQSGVSRQLFDRWASDPKNGVIVAGFAVEGTLAKEILHQPTEVVTLEGRRQPLNCLVDYVSFSAHVDFVQNRSFITKVNPKHIVLVHGQKDEMGRLKSALMLQYRQVPENKRPTITMPPNLQEVKLKFTRRRSAKVMGRLAQSQTQNETTHEEAQLEEEQQQQQQTQQQEAVAVKEGDPVEGILVTHNFSSKIVSPDDLPTYTPLRVGSVSSSLHVPYSFHGSSYNAFRLFLNEMFTGITETILDEGGGVDGGNVVRYGLHHDQVTVTMGRTRGIATVDWEASPVGDVFADAVVALLMHSQSSAASIRLTGKPCNHGGGDGGEEDKESRKKRLKTTIQARFQMLQGALEDTFEHVEAHMNEDETTATHEGTFVITTDIESAAGGGSSSGGSHNETAATSATEFVTCTVVVKFKDDNADAAEISVQCEDDKLASNIQDCLRNLATAAAPIQGV